MQVAWSGTYRLVVDDAEHPAVKIATFIQLAFVQAALELVFIQTEGQEEGSDRHRVNLEGMRAVDQ